MVQSLSASFHMIKGNWWRIFGYTILLFLILGVVGMIINLIGLPIGILLKNLGLPDLWISFLNFILSDIINLVYTLISVPFSILFYKNIYLEMRGNKVKKKKK